MAVRNRIQHYLQSTPIEDLTLIGDWSAPQSFSDKRDVSRLNRPEFMTKLRSSFDKTPFKFNLWFINKAGYEEYLEQGEVGINWLHKYMPEAYEQIKRDKAGYKVPTDAITIIFTNNDGDNKIVMTPWIIAHRIGHTLRQSPDSPSGAFSNLLYEFEYAISNSYKEIDGPEFISKAFADLLFMQFISHVCKFRSVGNPDFRIGELLHEFMAQFILNGKITFNDPPAQMSLRSQNPISKFRAVFELVRPKNMVLTYVSKLLSTFCTHSLSKARGRIFVM